MLRAYTRHSPLVLAIALVLLSACEREDRERVGAEADTLLDTTRARIGAAVDTVAGRVAGREYTNAEFVGFINAYNDAEMEVGEMAQTNATDPQVRDFAQRIVQDHRALKTAVTDAARQRNITPTMPSADSDLREDHEEGMRELRNKARGREFDEAFLEHEIEMHRKVLDEVEDALGRNRNQEIRNVLEQARARLRAHLQTAQELERKFGV